MAVKTSAWFSNGVLYTVWEGSCIGKDDAIARLKKFLYFPCHILNLYFYALLWFVYLIFDVFQKFVCDFPEVLIDRTQYTDIIVVILKHHLQTFVPILVYREIVCLFAWLYTHIDSLVDVSEAFNIDEVDFFVNGIAFSLFISV